MTPYSGTRYWCVFLHLFLLILVALTCVAPASADDSRYRIQLLDGSFTPSPGLSPAIEKRLVARADELRAKGYETLHVLVQLHEVPTFAYKQSLWRDGLDLGSYVPGNAYVAAVPVDRALELARRAEVRWLTVWDASKKLHPRLARREIAPYARDSERPGWVMLMLQLHHDVELARGPALVEAAGGVAMEPLAGVHGLTVWLPEERIAELAEREEVLWLEEGPPPLGALNDSIGIGMRADLVAAPAAPAGLDGSGVDLFVFDAGRVRSTHVTFDDGSGSRVTSVDADVVADHPTHVAGTAGGDGSGSHGGRGRGVAPGVDILTAGYQQLAGSMLFWDNAGDLQNDYARARNVFGADLGTNSIGSNTAGNGYACGREGDYGVTSNLIDGIVRGDNGAVSGPMIMTWANGNERTGGSPRGRCGSGYRTTAPPSCAKNPIHVGATNSDGGSMTAFSSWGPCDDGRLKPVVTAPGCESGRVSGETYIYSSLSGSNTAYGGSGWCGTSMSTPAVAGVVALLIEDWRALGHGGADDRPLPAVVKAMMIQTAEDQGQPGPDYVNGYGGVDAEALIALLRDGDGSAGSGMAGWGAGMVANGAADSYAVDVPAGTGELRVSLAWDDAAAAAFAGSALVNDLDLELIAPDGTVHRPFVLDPARPERAAKRGVNVVDNQEQAVVANPVAGTWTIRVAGSKVPAGPQSYGLAHRVTPTAHDGGACVTTAWDWESGADGWKLSGAARAAAPAGGHGSWSLRLGGSVSTVDEATRDVTIPADAAAAEWTFSWHMTTDEGKDGHGYDNFTAEIRDATGKVLSVIDARSDGWAEGAWMTRAAVDLLPWAGQKVRLAFRATNDKLLATRFYVDDAVFRSCSGTGGGGGDSDSGGGGDSDSGGGGDSGAGDSDGGDSDGGDDGDDDDGDTGPCPGCVDWSATATVSYSTQDVAGNVAVEDGGATLRLADNTWRRTTRTWAITTDTVLEFEFASAVEGEVHGIGFDADDGLSGDRVFKLHGTQGWGIRDYRYTAPGTFQSFKIRVGRHFTGDAMFLVLANDNDAGAGNDGRFRNVRVYEEKTPAGCAVENDFEGSVKGWSNSPASTCATGTFVLGTPDEESSGGLVTQVGGDHTSGSGRAIFTAANVHAGDVDVDAGACIADSPVWRVEVASTLEVWYFHGQRDTGDDPGDDVFRIEVSLDGGASYAPVVMIDDRRTAAVWTRATAQIPAGSDVRLRLEVADGVGPADIIEGGIDDLSICPN